MKISYNQIIDTFEGFATAHTQINEFATGDLWEVVQHSKLTDFKYPLLFITDAPASLGEDEITMSFEVLVMDKAEEDFENEVKSDTLLILLDIIAYFEKLYADDWKFVTIQKSGSATPFTERFDDTVTGWSMSLSLKMPLQYDECQIPYTGHTPDYPDISIPITVSNSDDTYSVTTSSDLELTDITHTDSDLSSVVLPAQTAMVCTPASAQSGIAYQRPIGTGQYTSADTYDEGWHRQNGSYNYTPPAYPNSYALLDFSAGVDGYMTLIDNNAFGHKFRLTGKTGGYRQSDNVYVDVNGTVTTLALAFPDDYIIDHLTGLGYYALQQGQASYSTMLADTNSSTVASFSDWRVYNLSERNSIIWLADSGNVGSVRMMYDPFADLNVAAAITQNRDWWTISFRGALTIFKSGSDGLVSHGIISTGNYRYYMVRNHYT